MDCGAAVLQVVSKYFQMQVDYRWIRERLRVGPDGATLESISEVSDEMKLRHHLVQYSQLEELGAESGVFIMCGKPALIQAGYGHYVVYRVLSGGRAEISDPSCGVRRVDVRSVEGRFENTCLFFPDAENSVVDQTPRIRNPGPALQALVKKYLSGFIVVVVLAFLASVLSVVPAVIFGKVVDSLQARDGRTLGWLMVYLLCLGSREFIGYIKTFRFLKLGQLFSFHLTGVLIRRILRVNWQTFSSRRYGDYTGRLGAIGDFQRFASDVLDSVFSRMVTLVLTCITLALIDIRLMLIAASIGAAILGLNSITVRKKAAMGYQMDIVTSGNGSNIYELLALKRWIGNNSFYPYFFRRWSRLTKRVAKMNSGLARFSFFWDSTGLWLSVLLELCGFVLVLRLFSQGVLTSGEVITAISLQAALVGLVSSFDGIQLSYRSAKLSYDRVQDLFMDNPALSHGRSILASSGAIRQIDLEGVSFGFKGERGARILERLDLSLSVGKIVAIRGPSGSGKSTILGLICGSLIPFEGEFRINGADSLPWGSVSQLRLCAFVDQELRFFDGTIYENLCLGEMVPEAEIHELLGLAGLSEAVSQFPKGIHSEISDFSRGLSGGQLQRIAVIRALVSRRPVVVLDEPTSSLDELSERKIMDLLMRFKSRRIILISTHSDLLTTVADEVISLEAVYGGN